MDLKNIPIPQDVVDENEYKKMLILQRHPAIHNTIYISSNGDEINIAMLPHLLERKIQNLSKKEQDDVRNMKQEWMTVRGRISAAKAKAYGRSGRFGGKTRDKIGKYQISPLEQDIMTLLGRMFTVGEVVKILREDNGLDVTDDDVKRVLREHIVDIEKQRDEFRNKISDVRLYNKRPRLEELSWMYSKMKTRYIALNSVDAYNAMLRTLEQIRKEAEGDVLTINGALDVNVEMTVQKHIQEEIYKTVNLKEIILSRVASRMNYDVHKLISGLHNSYYAKFVRISGEYEEGAEMKYPSATAYDFNEIERNAEESVVDMTPEKLKDAETTKAHSIRELFLQKIRKQERDIENKTFISNSITDAEVVEQEEQPIKRGRGRYRDKKV